MFSDNQPTRFGGFIEIQDGMLEEAPAAQRRTTTMLNLKEFMHDVHRNARDHGWWDEERGERSVRALIVSEWSEALEEARAGRPLVWHGCADAGNPAGAVTMCEAVKDCPCKVDMNEVDCAAYVEKPEGIAIELMDGCIRIMDWLGSVPEAECALPETIEKAVQYGRYLIEQQMTLESKEGLAKTENVPVDVLVDLLTERTMMSVGGYREWAYAHALCIACAWVDAMGEDPEKLLLLKHRYNMGRPYKHGKKF